MLVIDLIDRLKTMDPELEVYFAHPSHDYWRSELASKVSSLEEEPLKHSAYHNQMMTLDEEKREEVGDDEPRFVVLRS